MDDSICSEEDERSNSVIPSRMYIGYKLDFS